jgi:hypothetical protein
MLGCANSKSSADDGLSARDLLLHDRRLDLVPSRNIASGLPTFAAVISWNICAPSLLKEIVTSGAFVVWSNVSLSTGYVLAGKVRLDKLCTGTHVWTSQTPKAASGRSR